MTSAPSDVVELCEYGCLEGGAHPSRGRGTHHVSGFYGSTGKDEDDITAAAFCEFFGCCPSFAGAELCDGFDLSATDGIDRAGECDGGENQRNKGLHSGF